MKINPVANYSGNTHSTYINPISKTAFEGRNTITKPIVDSYCFSHSDKSLTPSFLKGLLDIKEVDPIAKIEKIKDKMLKAMGYKHPELMNIELAPNTFATFDTYIGSLIINPYMIREMDIKDAIGIIRHELEHMAQETRLYKSLGEDAYINIIKQKNKDNPEFRIYKISNLINLDFYRQMSKDADISNFDAEKFRLANLDYGYDTSTFEGMHKYLENPIEKEAYIVQKRVLNSCGLDRALAPDTFPKNYETIIGLMDALHIPRNKQFDLYNAITYMHIMKEYLSKSDIAEIVPIMSKIEHHQVITENDKKVYYEIMDKVEDIGNKLTEKQYSDILKKTESSLRQGKHTVKDIFSAI